MAEGNGEEENPYSFRNFSRKKESTQNEDSDGTEDTSVKPDLGIGNQLNFEKKTVSENHGSSEHRTSQAGNDMPKREENPFSFKHFLKRDTGNSYHSTGARPKVYTNISTSDSFDHSGAELSDADPGLYTPRHVATPELTSVLPDFVQDHLVVEQCYLNHSDGNSAPQLAVDLENLPDFAINNISTAQEPDDGNKVGNRLRQWDEPKNVISDVLPKDIPFDLTGTTSDQNFSRRVRKNSGSVPLALPRFDRSPAENLGRSGGRLPFDLPLVGEVDDLTASSNPSGVRSGPHLGEVGASKSLPDFLSDGPIHSGRHSDVVENADNLAGCNTSNGLPRTQLSEEQVQRFQVENERLRRELEVSRRQLMEQTRRIQLLEKELCTMQSKEHEETASLEKAIEQVEDNLKRSTRRAVIAENQVSKLKQETKILMSEVTQLRRENRDLLSGQGPSISSPLNHEQQTQRLAHELRAAAGSAEMSLRQLLNGVGNLRVIASTLESMHRIHDRTTDFLSDMEEDESGPAL